MMREYQVRFCERLGAKFPGPTRLYEAPENAISVNNVTAKKDADGAVTVHFGGDPTQPNYLRIMPGWNYTVRLYRPRPEVLDGKWTFRRRIRRAGVRSLKTRLSIPASQKAADRRNSSGVMVIRRLNAVAQIKNSARR